MLILKEVPVTNELANGSASKRFLTGNDESIVDTSMMQRIVEEDSDALRLERRMEIGFSIVFLVIFFALLCFTLCERAARLFASYRRTRDSVASLADERRQQIARSLIIKHVLQKSKLEPREADDDCPGIGTTSSKRMMLTDEELLSEQEDRAVMQVSLSPASVPNRRIQRLKSNLVISDNDEDIDATVMDSTQQPWLCAICLIPYKVGDEICWTRNPACIHVFHHVCIQQWLRQHHDCPVCRAAYIFVPPAHDTPWSTLENRCLNGEDPLPTIETSEREQGDAMTSRLEEGGLVDPVLNSTGRDSRDIVTEPLSSGTDEQNW